LKFKVQVGPPLKNQAVTKPTVAAFSFALNTNLNTTPRQLIAGPYGIHLCSCPCVQILGSDYGWGKRKTKENHFLLPSLYL
ncbi:hypothetical protein, partial [uncultured Duncaniella sp.]|uniref:hypothetical protein n=1 Tax=uncultured Duncaniella sp. TaxID=2768039 RepID=UPI00267764AC